MKYLDYDGGPGRNLAASLTAPLLRSQQGNSFQTPTTPPYDHQFVRNVASMSYVDAYHLYPNPTA